jgi:hypothetical protein
MGSAPLTNGGGSIADLIPQEKRGAAMSIFILGPLLGPGGYFCALFYSAAEVISSHWAYMGGTAN